MNLIRVFFLIALICATDGIAFESTKVLPEGIRNLSIRTITTDTRTKTNRNGDIEPLAEPLWKPLKFRNILSSETGLKKKQLEAFLIQQGWSTEDSVGDFYADLEARINVMAPIFAYGLTEKTTLAVAVPIYSASTDISVGLRTNEGAEKFLAALRDPLMNNNKSAIEAAEKFSNYFNRLNTKLTDNGYDTFEAWNTTDVGDTSILAKHLLYNGSFFKAAISPGITMPTGRQDNPNILTDLPFGDGQWDVFAQALFDQWLTDEIMLNQHLKYTYQAPGTKEFRLKTREETIEVVSQDLDFKLGDKVDAGASIQYQQKDTGINTGLGLTYYRKFADEYTTDDLEAKDELQRDTDQNALYWQARLGVSTLDMFKRKEFPIPLIATIEYRKQYASRNVPRTHFTQVDLRLFF